MLNLYRSNLAKYDVNKRRFTYNATGLILQPGHQFIYTGTAQDIFGTNFSTTNNFTEAANT